MGTENGVFREEDKYANLFYELDRKDDRISGLEKVIRETMHLMATNCPEDGIIWYNDGSTLWEHLAYTIGYDGEPAKEFEDEEATDHTEGEEDKA